MNYKIALGASLLLLLLNMTSCFKERTCRDKAPLTGTFKVEERIGIVRVNGLSTDPFDYNFLADQLIEGFYYSKTDTVIAGRKVLFTAMEEADRYEWTVGSDPRTFEGKRLELYFFQGISHDEFTPTSVGITLRLFKDHPFCYPADSIVTNYREVVFVPVQQSAILGKYRGSSSRFPNEMYEIDIMLSDNNRSSINNFPKGCRASMQSSADTLRGVNCSIGYKALTVDGGTHYGEENCYHTAAIGRLDDEGKLQIQYRMTPELSGFPQVESGSFIYEGIKLQ